MTHHFILILRVILIVLSYTPSHMLSFVQTPHTHTHPITPFLSFFLSHHHHHPSELGEVSPISWFTLVILVCINWFRAAVVDPTAQRPRYFKLPLSHTLSLPLTHTLSPPLPLSHNYSEEICFWCRDNDWSEESVVSCNLCPKVYHPTCLGLDPSPKSLVGR